ncbi:MAG TPA: type IV toxin-antitoxin system AbiEi family antitoxin [Geobacteraceae bacterium]|nr:type IV toxin-antitoxin system AbiEi family antitoxin [Geobacteraceae bacterium]
MNNKITEHNRATENEADILRQAMEVLKALASLEYEAEPVQDLRDEGYDYTVRARVFGKEFVWCVGVRNRLTKAVELQALINKDKARHPFLLATWYVPPEAAARLHDGGIQFIDTVGNAFVNQPPLLIFVKGNRPEKEEAPAPTARLFKGVGLKIAYLFLCRPELVDRPYRDLAGMTDVALGTVNGTMTEMIRKGFILDMGEKGKKLLDRKTLFERWIAAYPDYLKPKLLLGRFRADGDWWKDIQLDPAIAQWGGEVAAAKLTGYLKPVTVTLYADKNHLADLVIANRLKKDPRGNVEILERFWPLGNDFGEGEIVHPILIYADLVAIGEQRTMETARMIYERHLDRYFRED